MNQYVAITICIIAGLIWLVGVNYIGYQSFKRRNISIWNKFHPLPIFKLEGIDYLKIIVLTFTVFAVVALTGILSGNFQT